MLRDIAPEKARFSHFVRPIINAVDFDAGTLLDASDTLCRCWQSHRDKILVIRDAAVLAESPEIHSTFVALCRRQTHVLTVAGVSLRRCHILHLNKNYVKRGPIEPAGLFASKNVTTQVRGATVELDEKIADLLREARKANCPDVQIGQHCTQPTVCPLKDHCWAFLRADNVLTLYRGGRKAWNLLEQGIVDLNDIPDGVPLTSRQKIQVHASRSGRTHVRPRALRLFLNQIRFPAYFLDFETVNPAIPIWDNTRCFEQAPFQFSLHVLEGWGATPQHYGYLSNGQGDPRPEIIHRLAQLIRPEGTILAYNAAFEIGVLNRSADMFPEHRPWWKSARNRFLDLLQPFREFDFYALRQRGSASMKAVLPALCDVGYEGLAVQNGTAASQAFLRTTFDDVTPDEKARIRKNLEAYCSRDTEGMIFILRELKRLADS